MNPLSESENERANRIARRIDEYHSLLSNIYENIVDRDVKLVKKDVQFLMMELRCVLKSIEEDDF
jgi:hypothetical protein